MLISDITAEIPIEAIYTDRITTQCEFPYITNVPTPGYWRRFRAYLQSSGARILAWRRKEIELLVNYEGLTIPVTFKLLRVGNDKPLYIYFSFNPITLRNQRSGITLNDDVSEETPFIAMNNFLREEDKASSADIAHEVDAFASVIQDQLIELVDGFHGQFTRIPITYCKMQIQHLETFVDINCRGVGNSVQLFTDVFPSAFRRTRRRTYRSSECVFGSDEAVQFVEGYYRSGVRAKLYEKTDRRIRAEMSFTKRALKYRSIDTLLSGDNSFADAFPSIAELVQPLFQMFLTPLSAANDQALSVADIEAFAAIISRTSPENAIGTINRLVGLRRITTASMPRARRQQLLGAGILERVDRGVLRLVPRYRHALERIQHALASNQEAA